MNARPPKSRPPKARPTPSGWQQFKVLLGRDLRQEMHTWDMVSAMGVYSLLVLIIFGAALSQGILGASILQISGGLVWAMVVFTSLLGLNRSFAADREEGGLEGVLLVPLDRSVIFLAKAASNLLFLSAVEIVAIPLFYFFFLAGQPLTAGTWMVIWPILAGNIGIAGIGTLLATMTGRARGRDVLLAILFIPIVFPLLYAVTAATTVALTGAWGTTNTFLPALALAFGYDVIMISLSWLLYGFVVSN